ncbi:MAG: WYL domain-containing protein [Flavobacteriales bacterium]|nr:WYL domain-containing protein [Flavobacteriales bacterium]
MSYTSVYDRHAAILDFIRCNSKPRTADIENYLEDIGDPIGIRSIQRALNKLNAMPGVTVIKRGLSPNHWYELEEDETEETPLLYSYLESSRLANTFKSELQDEKAMGQIIYPDVPLSKGLDNIAKLIPAIKKRKQVSFEYHKFTGDISKRVVCPYYLKQFRKRWYLIAKDTKDDTVKSFGLDRIEKLKPTNASFKLLKKDDPKHLFENVIGLFEKDGIPTKIKIWSEPYNANYLRTLPLHRSQKEIGEQNGGYIFELTIVPNFEFYQEILRMSYNVKIVSPDSVKQEMIDTLKEIRSYYQ